MSSFTGNDGSGLVGGLNPSGQVKALSVDASGNLNIIADNLVQIGGATPQIDNSHMVGVSLYGKNSAAGDTPIAVDSSGRVITLDSIRALILNGQCFNGTTGKLTAPTANVSHSLFNPNGSGKLFVVFMARLSIANAGFHTLALTTVDPALGTNSQVNNLNQNSATTSVASCTYINTSHTADGTEIDGVQAPSGTVVDFLNPDNGALFILKANTGLEINVTGTSGNAWQSVFRWAEI